MADHKHAQYLTKDGKTELHHKDDIEDALKNGWTVADGEKSNGEPWNPETRDDEVSILDAQAEVQRSNKVRQDKIDAEDAKEEAKTAESKADAAKAEAPKKSVQK